MVLVDTSVWIDHFRNANDQLMELLNEGAVLCHPFIMGELACGNIKNRKEILKYLQDLPQSSLIEHEEILQFTEKNQLMGKGLGYIDIAILASSLVSGIPLWTLDQLLNDLAKRFNAAYRK